jgi:hypothetical protein
MQRHGAVRGQLALPRRSGAFALHLPDRQPFNQQTNQKMLKSVAGARREKRRQKLHRIRFGSILLLLVLVGELVTFFRSR